MALGDLYETTAGGSTDVYYVDTETYDVPEYSAIYIVDAPEPALVDTGIGRRYEVVLDAMSEVGIAPEELSVIAPTHVHLDHAGGAGYLAAACPNADVCVHERGARHLVDPGRLWAGTKAAVGDQIEHYAEPKPVPEDRVRELADGDRIDLGDRALEVHDAPGHAPHQAVFYDPATAGVFTADAAGIYTPALDAPYPTSPPPNFDLPTVLGDVETIRELDPDVLYYGHFGDHEPGGLLDAYADTIEEWVGRVERASDRAASERGGHGGDDADGDGSDGSSSDGESRTGTAHVDAVVDRLDPRPDSVAAWGEFKAREELRMNVRGVLASLGE